MIQATASGAQAAVKPARAQRSARRIRPELMFIQAMWILALFDPIDLPLVPRGVGIGKIVILLAVPAILIALRYGRPSDLYWPFVLFAVLHLTALPFALNRGFVRDGFIEIARLAILFTATLALFKSRAQALWLMKAFLLSFIWYGIQGIPSGKVSWHPEHGNTDGFGGLMLMAIGVGYAAANSSAPRWRYIGYSVLALGLLGVVASFARGAALGAALVLFLLWLRSRRKLATLGAGIAVAGIMIPVIEVMYPEGSFWSEMQTISEGTTSGTGHSRSLMWKIAFEVFRESPVFGVGSFNTGPVASEIIEPGMLADRGRFASPNKLYNRGVHNTYLQLLAEQGIVGFGLWMSMLVGFLLRVRRLRRPRLVAAWNRAVGGQFELHRTTVGLELAMIGYMVGAFFYNQTYIYWFYTLVLIALLIERTAPRSRLGSGALRGTHPGRSRA